MRWVLLASRYQPEYLMIPETTPETAETTSQISVRARKKSHAVADSLNQLLDTDPRFQALAATNCEGLTLLAVVNRMLADDQCPGLVVAKDDSDTSVVGFFVRRN